MFRTYIERAKSWDSLKTRLNDNYSECSVMSVWSQIDDSDKHYYALVQRDFSLEPWTWILRISAGVWLGGTVAGLSVYFFMKILG